MAITGQTNYELGQDNVQFLGLDVHNPVFAVSSLTRMVQILRRARRRPVKGR